MNKKKIVLSGFAAAMLADALRAAQISKITAMPPDMYKEKGGATLPAGLGEPSPITDTEIHAPAEQEYKYAGQMTIPKGAKLWAYNYNLDTIKEVETSNAVVITDKGERIERKVAQQEPDTIYIKAINRKNAERKVEALKKAYQIATNQPKND